MLHASGSGKTNVTLTTLLIIFKIASKFWQEELLKLCRRRRSRGPYLNTNRYAEPEEQQSQESLTSHLSEHNTFEFSPTLPQDASAQASDAVFGSDNFLGRNPKESQILIAGCGRSDCGNLAENSIFS